MVKLNNVAIFIVFDLLNKNGNKTKINCGKKKTSGEESCQGVQYRADDPIHHLVGDLTILKNHGVKVNGKDSMTSHIFMKWLWINTYRYHF